MVDQTNSDQITLIDPLKKALFQLPPISASYSSTDEAVAGFEDHQNKNPETQQKYSVHKAVLSSSPNDNIVMVIYGELRELAYYKAGNKTWTKLQEAGCYFDDVIFHKGEFYAVDELGKVVTCKPDCPPTVREIAMPWLLRGNKAYLVSLKDYYFCVVVRFLKDNPNSDLGYKTCKFEVYLLHWSGECRRMASIEDWALFLGQNDSAALPTKTFKGLNGNCIYFTDDNWERSKYGVVVGHDLGVFDVGEQSFQPFECCAYPGSIWFIPK